MGTLSRPHVAIHIPSCYIHTMKSIARQKTTTQKEDEQVAELFQLFKKTPIAENELLSNLGLFITSKNLSRILFMDFLFRQITPIQGSIMEFGVRWGQNITLFSTLRALYEPFNRHRKVIAFDTFDGLRGIHKKDGAADFMKEGAYTVSENYDEYLSKILDLHEKMNPIPHFKKFYVQKGLAQVELKRFFEDHPETIVALAFFDLDLYKPTKECLLILKERLTKGSIIAFDELNEPECPGETLALKEVFGLDRYSIKRYPFASRVSYIVIE